MNELNEDGTRLVIRWTEKTIPHPRPGPQRSTDGHGTMTQRSIFTGERLSSSVHPVALYC